jgi:hypothetical protein
VEAEIVLLAHFAIGAVSNYAPMAESNIG